MGNYGSVSRLKPITVDENDNIVNNNPSKDELNKFEKDGRRIKQINNC